ncbi:hypothetical protein [Haploplasma axanthum]|uniref:GGDEF domain-containing protein n=1 Tax=Haploplasma axanthum TaxID=29552 RepID=A0A449BF68_HAPAX|nr:hypothetical protein [Haploplasma axanthum]VEU81081.1 Uncharacterised protein [Haploplasma axanthum]
MFYLSLIQKEIIAIAVVIVFLIIGYILVRIYLYNRNKIRENEMLTLNQVIKYKKFGEYLNYKIKKNEEYALYLISINNFDLLERTYNDSTIRTYLRNLARNLSMYLPYGGKIAQTKSRDTFILYVPAVENDYEVFGINLKNAALEQFNRNGISIRKTISIGYIDEKFPTISEQIEKNMFALIQSRRELGTIVKYDQINITSLTDYKNCYDEVRNNSVAFDLQEVVRKGSAEETEIYVNATINNIEFNEYLKSKSKSDQAWINFWLTELIIEKVINVYGNRKIILPISLKMLEKESFFEVFTVILSMSKTSLSQITISIKEDEVIENQIVIKNLLELRNIGIKISFEVKNISQALYSIIQSYHVSRIELSKDVLTNGDLSLEELYYFVKVNQIEVQLNEEIENDEATHIVKNTNNRIIVNGVKKNRGRK